MHVRVQYCTRSGRAVTKMRIGIILDIEAIVPLHTRDATCQTILGILLLLRESAIHEASAYGSARRTDNVGVLIVMVGRYLPTYRIE